MCVIRILYLLSAGLTGRSRQVAMYLVGYNVLICAVLVPLLYLEVHFGIPLIKASALALELDLDQQLAAVYVFLCVFLLPVMLAGLKWSVSVLERLWPTSPADELSRPQFIHDHASVDVDTSLMLVDLEQRRAVRELSEYFDAVRRGERIAPLRAGTRKLISDITEFLDDLQKFHPMQGVEDHNSMRNRQKLLGWLEDALGVLCETLADLDDRSPLAQLRTTICESVDGVLLALVDAMDSDDPSTWDLIRQLTGDRGEMMRDLRSRYLEWDPPLQHLELIRVLLITNSVEEAFFLFSKMEKEFNPTSSIGDADADRHWCSDSEGFEMGGKKAEPLAVVHRDSAGIDVGKRKHYVAVDPSRFDEPVRNFGSFTQDLEAMAEWLSSCGVREVAMESTGVYWVPVFEVLDRAGFEVHLVNPRATKQVSGRKSDVLDCQWIRQLMSYGLLRGAFRSPDALCPMRSYVRQRGQLIRDRSRAVQHMQKALGQMNVQLDNVLSDIMGKTGQLIVRAIVAGERDGAALAKFRDGRCKADETTIAASLRGNWRGEHLFALQQALARHDLLQGQIEACEARIDGELDGQVPGAAANEPSPARRARESVVRERLHRMLGADLTAIPTVGVETALTVAAEVGADLSRFATAGHFCSWLGLAPGTRISGDKRLGGPSARHTNRVGQALRMAASTARNSKTTIGAAHRRRLARMDSAKAVKATAHQLARLIYAMLTRGEQYVERDLATMETQRRDRQIKNLQRQARHFDLALVPAEQAA